MPEIFCKSLLLLIGLAIVFFGDPVYSQSPTTKDADRIHQGDVIEVDVIGSFEFDWRGRLNPEGYLDRFDKITEPVYARCKSVNELSEFIAREYSKILRDPKVEIRIIDRNGRALVYIDGAVKNPQRLRIKRDIYLNELIVLGGGIIETAGGEINIFRPETSSCDGVSSDAAKGPISKTIKIAGLLAAADGANPKIVSGDIVTVVESLPIYVIGGVNNPKRIDARAEMTLSRAVATAGGVAKNGISGSVTVFRREGGGSKVIEADLDKIAAGNADDHKLQPYDIVEVAQKGSAKRRFPPVIDDRSRSLKLHAMPVRVIE